LPRNDLRTIWVRLHLYRRGLTQRILLKYWVRRSWDFETDVHSGGNRHLCFGNDCEENRSDGFVEGCAIDDEGIGIVLS
jgi:hypothetical protein